MNPLTELRSLIELFPGSEMLFTKTEHIPARQTPEPYKGLLVHDQHMTVTMEEFHHSPVAVSILERRHEGEIYARKIILTATATGRVVQFGIVRFDFSYVSAEVRAEIVRGTTPLGRILINHNVLRQIDLNAILRITPGPELQRLFNSDPAAVTYGRLATIFCNEKPAVDLLEVSAPLVWKE